MPEKNPPKKTLKKVETIVHDEASRRNIPTAEYQSLIQKEYQDPLRVAYERRNRDLDPQLVWRGKDEQDWSDHRHIDRNHSGDTLERLHRIRRYWVVLTDSVNVAHVNLLQPKAMLAQKPFGFDHSWIDLTGMADVKAEARFWQSIKDLCQFRGSAPDRFAIVHVLDNKEFTKVTPQSKIRDGIWVNDNWNSLRDDRPQGFDKQVFMRLVEGTGSVEGNRRKMR